MWEIPYRDRPKLLEQIVRSLGVLAQTCSQAQSSRGSVFVVLEQISSVIVSNRFKHAQATYGHFAIMITILWWFYPAVVVTLLGAQLNVVLKERLFPRSVVGARQADRKEARAGGAEDEERIADGAGRPDDRHRLWSCTRTAAERCSGGRTQLAPPSAWRTARLQRLFIA